MNRVTGLAALIVFCIPATGIPGLPFLGELMGSASIHVALLAMPVAFLTGRMKEIPRFIRGFALSFLAVVAVSTLVNLDSIMSANLNGRSGAGKELTVLFVFIFGFILSIFYFNVIDNRKNFERIFLVPSMMSIWMCVFFAIPEVIGRLVGNAETLTEWYWGFFHAFGGAIVSPDRMANIGFEPPDFSYYCAITLPFITCLIRLRRQEGRKVDILKISRALLLLLLILANSRTGIAMAVVYFCVEILMSLKNVMIVRAAIVSVVLIGIVGQIFLLQNVAILENSVLRSHSVSNMSRFATSEEQFKIFLDYPALGVGLGQFPFHGKEYLPSWSYLSWEIRQWYFGQFGGWKNMLPPSFVFFTRLAADLGLAGLAVWYGAWCLSARRLWARQRSGDCCPADAVIMRALLCAIAEILVGGFTADSVRRPETWIVLGLAARFAYAPLGGKPSPERARAAVLGGANR